MNWLADYLAHNPLATLAIVFFAPFVQEDTAVIAAATASVSGHDGPVALYVATLLGLTLSDVWKYWLGRFAKTHPWIAKVAANPRVNAAREKVLKRTIMALMVARFVPGTRIPLYIACGVFHVPFLRFFVVVVASAALYIGLAFAVFASFGKLVGERISGVLPFVAVAVVLAVLAVQFLRVRARKA